MENGKYVDGSLWFYAPNKGAPVAFAAWFLVSVILHGYQCGLYKSWRVSGLFPWAALLFVIGYILREVGAYNYDNVDIFISSQVFIYCAPPVYELQNYFILSRILYYVPYHSPIHPGRVLTTFGGLSAIIEALNGNGASYVANTSLPQSKQDIGKALLKSALILQLVVLILFVLLAAYFHHKCRRSGQLPKNLNAILITLYCSSALIGTRTIYRTYEYFTLASLNFSNLKSPSSLSPVIRYEWYFYIFESSLMVINTFLMNFHHPMRHLPRDNKIYLAADGITEIKGPGYQDTRNFVVTLIDPFDIAGLIKGRNMEKRFWETHDAGRAVESTPMEVGKNDKAGSSAVGASAV